MRNIPSQLQAKLDSGATTLCRCWIVRRRDGIVQGFTDHDEDVSIDSVLCRAGTGLSGTEATQKLGLGVDSSEISGALADDSLNEANLAAGRYDAASVELWLTDWSEPHLRVLLAKGSLGEVRREGAAFTVELRGLSERLGQDSGRRYTASCSADLGDARCKVDLVAPAFRGSGTVAAVDATSSFMADGLDGFANGWFTAGKLTFGTGANAGWSVDVKLHRNDGIVTLDLWQAPPETLAPGDSFIVTAGCDKSFATCHDRFDNVVNFRGFPHMPGNDFVIRYPVLGDAGNNGGSLNS